MGRNGDFTSAVAVLWFHGLTSPHLHLRSVKAVSAATAGCGVQMYQFLKVFVVMVCSVAFAPEVASGQSYLGYQQLHVSLGGPADAEYLFDSVIEGSDGRIYGSAVNGGSDDGGVVFRMNKDGSDYQILHAFTVSTNDGLSPWGKVIEASDGMLYGATRAGGSHGV